MKKITIFFLSVITMALGAITSARSADTPNNVVGINQITEAGFGNVTIQNPEPGKFLTPSLYFRVKEKVAGEEGKAWGDSANLVSVLIQPVSDLNWLYNNGQIEEINLSGRIQVNLSNAGYFISVTGPDKQKVETLAHNLKVLY